MEEEIKIKPSLSWGKGGSGSKNGRIKAALFKDKGNRKPKKIETEAQEVKRLQNILAKNEVIN